jgi:hypothetical protein
LVTHARDIWWTLDSANAFVSPGVNSRGKLVPSHGASRRRLGDYIGPIDKFIDYAYCYAYIAEMSHFRKVISERETKLIKLWTKIINNNNNVYELNLLPNKLIKSIFKTKRERFWAASSKN